MIFWMRQKENEESSDMIFLSLLIDTVIGMLFVDGYVSVWTIWNGNSYYLYLIVWIIHNEKALIKFKLNITRKTCQKFILFLITAK